MPTTDRMAGAALAVFAVVAIEESLRLPVGSVREPGPAFVPLLLALLLLAFSLVIVVRGAHAAPLPSVQWGEGRHALAILGACAFAAVALERLGYRLTFLLAIGFLLTVVERKGLVATAVFAVGMAFGSYFVFDTLLRVPLPRGPLGF